MYVAFFEIPQTMKITLISTVVPGRVKVLELSM